MSPIAHFCTNLAFLFVAPLLIFGGTHSGAEEPEVYVDETGHVFEGLAELVIQRDDVNRRYMLMTKFENWAERANGGLRIHHGYHLQLKRRQPGKPPFHYIGHGFFLDVQPGMFFPSEHWRIIIRCEGRTRGTSGLGYRGELQPLPITKNGRPDTSDIFPANFAPYDNIMLLSDWFFAYFYNGKKKPEDFFLGDATLVKSYTDALGDVYSTWEMKFGEFDFVIDVVQQASSD